MSFLIPSATAHRRRRCRLSPKQSGRRGPHLARRRIRRGSAVSQGRIGHTEDVLIGRIWDARLTRADPRRRGRRIRRNRGRARHRYRWERHTSSDHLAARCRMSGGWLSRLKSGLAKSSSRLVDGIAGVFIRRRLDAEAIEELEDVLITRTSARRRPRGSRDS